MRRLPDHRLVAAILLSAGVLGLGLVWPAPVAADPWWNQNPGQPGISNLDVFAGDTSAEALGLLAATQLTQPLQLLATDPPFARLFQTLTITAFTHPLYPLMVWLAHALLALPLVAGLLSLITRRALLQPDDGVTGLLGRLLLVVIAIHVLPAALPLLVALSNLLAGLGAPTAQALGLFFGLDAALDSLLGGPLATVAQVVLALLFGLLLLQVFSRVILLNLLVLAGPVVLTGLIVPLTRAWPARWCRLLVATTFAHALQLLTLSLALALRGTFPGPLRVLFVIIAAYAALKVPSLLLDVASGPAGRLAMTTGTHLRALVLQTTRLRALIQRLPLLPAGPRPTPTARRAPHALGGILSGERWVPAEAVIRRGQALVPARPVPPGGRAAYSASLATFLGYSPATHHHLPGVGLRAVPDGDRRRLFIGAQDGLWRRVVGLLAPEERLQRVGDRAVALPKDALLQRDPHTGALSAGLPPAGVVALRTVRGTVERLVRRTSPYDRDDPARGGVHRLVQPLTLAPGARAIVRPLPAAHPGAPTTLAVVPLAAGDREVAGRIDGYAAADLARLAGLTVHRQASAGQTHLIGLPPGRRVVTASDSQLLAAPEPLPVGVTAEQTLLDPLSRRLLQAPALGIVDGRAGRVLVPADGAAVAAAQAEGRRVRPVVQRDPTTRAVTGVTYQVQPTAGAVWDQTQQRWMLPPDDGPYSARVVADPTQPQHAVFERRLDSARQPGLVIRDGQAYRPSVEALAAVARGGWPAAELDWVLTVEADTGAAHYQVRTGPTLLPEYTQLPAERLDRFVPLTAGHPLAAVTIPSRVADPTELIDLGPLTPVDEGTLVRVTPRDVTDERLRAAVPLTLVPDAQIPAADWLTPVPTPAAVRELAVETIATPIIPYAAALETGLAIDLGRAPAPTVTAPPPGPSTVTAGDHLTTTATTSPAAPPDPTSFDPTGAALEPGTTIASSPPTPAPWAPAPTAAPDLPPDWLATTPTDQGLASPSSSPAPSPSATTSGSEAPQASPPSAPPGAPPAPPAPGPRPDHPPPGSVG